MIVGEDFKPGDIVQIVTEDERVFSIRIPETANPTFRDFLDSCTPTPYNSDPDEVAELLMEFADLMDEILNTRLSFTYCQQPGCCDYPYCDCGHLTTHDYPQEPFLGKSLGESIAEMAENLRSADTSGRASQMFNPGTFISDLCDIDYEDDLYNGESTTLNNAQNVTIYADNVYMEGE